jgi:hypothetical protein
MDRRPARRFSQAAKKKALRWKDILIKIIAARLRSGRSYGGRSNAYTRVARAILFLPFDLDYRFHWSSRGAGVRIARQTIR